jgi:hypothetical protein
MAKGSRYYGQMKQILWPKEADIMDKAILTPSFLYEAPTKRNRDSHI